MDCDARVLSLGYPVARYSETLIAVGERQSASYAITMARYGSKSFLEQRIHNMLRKKTRHARVWALALACFGAGLAVCAAIAHPDSGVGKSLRDLSPLDQVREARTTASTESARIARDMNDQEVVTAYARVPGTGWLVFMELPIEEWTKN
jgi:hypothetical protein